ncbi:hypothetical protein CDD82_204 [Ophiocordyceps australis]|uniref:Uncharacterized protein n=1 Tax=Ophiocordyceps australis TaxID=1399860 RepID=A0A2C5YMP9_9HYPO|nr:hypothetical protein CDD82_204 [Ophiocordyceps australis]
MLRTRKHSLTPQQLDCVHDLFDMLLVVSNALSPMSFQFTSDDIWGLIIMNPVCPPCPLPALRLGDVAIQAGSFNQDLPPSKCAVRKQQILAKKTKKKPKRKNPVRPRPERCHGRPAFVCTRLNPAKRHVEWFWSDSSGKGTHVRYIDLAKTQHLGQKAALTRIQADALSHHDHVVVQRARHHNRNLLIYWAKCRLMRYLDPTNSKWHHASSHMDLSLLQEAPCLWPRVLNSPHTHHDLKALAPPQFVAPPPS